jgi:hypothetical protein
VVYLLLPFVGFHFMLIVFGAIISVAALIDPHHNRSAPSVGFALFLGPIFALILPTILFTMMESNLSDIGEIAGVGAYFLGLIGGAGLGLWLARKHKWHLLNPLTEADHDDDSDES